MCKLLNIVNYIDRFNDRDDMVILKKVEKIFNEI